MRFCPKCGELYDDQLLAFCLADGTPLGIVTPDSDVWKDGSRLFEQKQNALKTQQRKLKWRRAVLTTMLIATMAVCVAAVSRSIYVTVEPARGQLCITTFNDLNGDLKQDAGESGVSGLVFQVRGTDSDETLTTDIDGRVCSDLPVGKYTVVEKPQDGWIATTPKSQTITVNADQTATALFGSKRQSGNLCIAAFNDLNADGVKDANEPSLPGFVFQVRGADAAKTVPTDIKGIGCSDLAIGTYIVVAQPQGGWLATTPTTKTINVTADHAAKVFFGSRQERGKLCITAFEDSNGNHVRDASERGLPGIGFQVTGTGTAAPLTTDSQGGICSELSAGNYTVIERPQRGWSATTDTTLTVTVIAGQKTNVVFGSRQDIKQGRGTLCIAAFNDLNGNQKQDAGEAGLFGFAFQVKGAGPPTKLPTDRNGNACAELPLGTYTVTEIPKPGWNPTTPIKQTVILSSNRAAPLFFGSTKSKPECLEADKSRERQLILNQYERNWRNSIERERERVIAAAAPKAHGKARATLDQFKPQVVLRTCTTAFVTLSYVWIVEVLGGEEKPRTERINGRQNVACEKAGPNWICR